MTQFSGTRRGPPPRFGLCQAGPWAKEGVAKVHLILINACRGAQPCAHKPCFISGLNGSDARDLARASSHTTGRTVFRIRRLKPASPTRLQDPMEPGVPSALRTSLSLRSSPKIRLRSRLSGLLGFTGSAFLAWVGGDRSCHALPSLRNLSRPLLEFEPVALHRLLRPFALPSFRQASSLLWPLLTAGRLSPASSPRVRTGSFPSRRLALPRTSLMAFGLRCS